MSSASALGMSIPRALLSAGYLMVFVLGLSSRNVQAQSDAQPEEGRSWLAGDHHIHSRYSVDYDDSTTPPEPILGGDSPHFTYLNALMAKHYGLAWMVTTDHGGPNHSKVNMERAYPELLHSREVVADVLQFYGMELDTPGAEHSSLIIPHSDHEHHTLYDLESRFAEEDAYPYDESRDTEEFMLEALRYMGQIPVPPVVMANHPSRSAKGLGEYGAYSPRELRDWNDTAPHVAVGMEGAPGHQANAIHLDGTIDTAGVRGGYRRFPTMGGFDQMTARLGGLWDSMLGEGRRWWITSNSDSHSNWRGGGTDFWPGEYSKTYVFAAQSYDDVLDGIRSGRVFVTTGDLISELYVTASAGGEEASIGGTLPMDERTDVDVTIRLLDPDGPNHRDESPQVNRIDLIVGEITGQVADRSQDTNATTQVVRRFSTGELERDGDYLIATHALEDVHHSLYLRVRGTNTTDLEPGPDPRGENPWSDLWFYSNPVFIEFR